MAEKATVDDDPTLTLFRRFRKPALVVLVVAETARALPGITSGDNIRLVGGLLTIAFWSSFAALVWRSKPPVPADADEIRRRARPQIAFWSAWLAINCVWILAAAGADRLRASGFLLLLPLAFLALNVLVYARADSFAGRVALSREKYGR